MQACLLSGILWVGSSIFAFGYEIGDIATNDVTTPVELTVIDKQKTDQLRRERTPQLPPVFEFDPHVFEISKSRLGAAFARMRERFLDELKTEYGKRVLTNDETADEAFRPFVSAFQKRHPSFPVTPELALAWATGKTGQWLQGAWSSKLRQIMNGFIRPDEVPPGILSAGQVQILTNGAVAEPRMFPKRRLITVAQARLNLANRFAPDQQAIVAFVGEFVAENCFLNAEATRESRAKRLQTVWEAKHYKPGELVVAAGQRIDDQTKAALDELTRLLAQRQAESPREAQSNAAPAEIGFVVLGVRVPLSNQQLFFGAGGLLLLSLICLIGCWYYISSRKRLALTRLLPREATSSLSLIDAWETRALQSEQQANELRHLARAALVPRFLQWLKSQGVQQLLAHRDDLISVQKLAEMELSRLEQMLAQIQAPLEERLKAYECRIAELEQALAAKGAESRELIQTMIRLTRNKLESERKTAAGMAWN